MPNGRPPTLSSRPLRRRATWLLLASVTLAGTSPSLARGEPSVLDHTPRSKAEINRALKKILKTPVPRESPKEAAEALRHLNACRYLAGAPHDVVLDRTLGQRSQAACELLAELGHTSHNPPNRGWPDDRYALALTGARNSNLSGLLDHRYPLVDAVRSFVHDTDQDNIWHIGHRRWCLCPKMKRTGFGSHRGFVAMWATDDSRDADFEFDVMSWPPAGYVPAKYLPDSTGASWPPAWSIHVHPEKYEINAYVHQSVSVWAIGREPPIAMPKFQRWRKTLLDADRVPLHGLKRLERKQTRPAGLVWMPVETTVLEGSRFWVEVGGFRDPHSSEPKLIRYYVEGY